MSDKRDNESTPEEIEKTKRMLIELMRGMSKPITSDKLRKDVGPYEWDTGE